MTRETPPDDAEDAPDEARELHEERDAEEARVEELRERIARGEYRVDPEAIARRILERGGIASEQATEAEPAPPALRLVGETTDESAEPDAADAVGTPDDELVDEPDDGVEQESGA